MEFLQHRANVRPCVASDPLGWELPPGARIPDVFVEFVGVVVLLEAMRVVITEDLAPRWAKPFRIVAEVCPSHDTVGIDTETFVNVEDKVATTDDLAVEMDSPLRTHVKADPIIDDEVRGELSQTRVVDGQIAFEGEALWEGAGINDSWHALAPV